MPFRANPRGRAEKHVRLSTALPMPRVCHSTSSGRLRQRSASRFERGEVLDMQSARDIFAVASVCDLSRASGHLFVERGIVPQGADRFEPSLHIALTRKARALRRHPVGKWKDAPTAVREVAADDMRKRPAVADD